MGDFTLTANLCGYFSRNNSISSSSMAQNGWSKSDLTQTEIAGLKRVFYPEFVDFCSNTENGTESWTKNINQELQITAFGKELSFHLISLSIFFMPLGMTLFAIKIEMNGNDLNDATAVLSSLRAIDFYQPNTHSAFITAALLPIKEVFQQIVTAKGEFTYPMLIENGNKFRVFQIYNITGENPPSFSIDEYAKDGISSQDVLLYQLSTLSKVTTDFNEYSPSPAYLSKVVADSRISIFQNWQALALNDTFTVLAHNLAPSMVSNWQDCYFRMIYLHSIFEKSYLFQLNKQFRTAINESSSIFGRLLKSMGLQESSMATLIRDYQYYERWCVFHEISYNFLPIEINAAIDHGLCISKEQESLNKVLENEKNRQEEANARVENTLLFSLSILTLASCIWDLSCLLDQMFPYDAYLGSSILGYRSVSLLVIFIFTILVYKLFRGRK